MNEEEKKVDFISEIFIDNKSEKVYENAVVKLNNKALNSKQLPYTLQGDGLYSLKSSSVTVKKSFNSF